MGCTNNKQINYVDSTIMEEPISVDQPKTLEKWRTIATELDKKFPLD